MKKEEMKELEVRMKEQLKKAEEIARKIELLFEQDLKIEDSVKKESMETTSARIDKIARDIEELTGCKIDIEKVHKNTVKITAREIKRLTGYNIDVEELQKETLDEALTRLEDVVERTKEWKEVP